MFARVQGLSVVISPGGEHLIALALNRGLGRSGS